MNYSEAVSYIHSFLKFGSVLGLERITALLDKLGNPQNKLKFIHVAGTNGKGSTSTMMSEVLKSAGFKTGLFTSPYVFDFRERIQINNEYISESDLAKTTQIVKNAVESVNMNNIYPTEFEVITAIALLFFSKSNCDYVVLEVGLGGRFDSTNVIPCPQVAMITSISMDHTKILGDTIEKIAYEKSGIIKSDGNVVITSLQNPEAVKVISNQAEKNNAKLIIADYNQVEILNENIYGTDFKYKNNQYHISLVGRHQVENAIGVIESANMISGVTTDNIVTGIQNTVMHGRMEIVKTEPTIMIDGGHNEECSLALKDVISNYVDKNITAVIGMMEDKDCDAYLSNILPLCKRLILTYPDNPRSEKTKNLKILAEKYISDIIIENDPVKAYNLAVKLAEKNDFILICGSFYMLSDIYK